MSGDGYTIPGLSVRVLAREVDGGLWRCEDCGVVLADDESMYAHREVAHAAGPAVEGETQ